MKDNSLSYKLRIIKNQGSLIYNFRQFLLKNDGEGFEKIYDLIKVKKMGETIIHSNFVFSYDDLWANENNFCPDLPLEKTIIWNLVLIKKNIDVINEFIKAKKELEENILNASFIKAREILEWINTNCGYSLWGLEVKAFLDSMLNVDEDIGLTGVGATLFEFFKLKVDTREKGRRFEKKAFELCERMAKSIELKEYLQYRMAILGGINKENVASILFYESFNGLIDIFLSMQTISLNLIDFLLQNKIIKELLESIADICIDKSFQFLISKYNKQELVIASKFSTLIELFQDNNYIQFIQEFEKITKKNVHLIYLYVIALLNAGIGYNEIKDDGTITNKLIKSLYLYLTDNIGVNPNNTEELSSFSRISDCFTFGKELQYFLNDFFADKPAWFGGTMYTEEICEVREFYLHSDNPFLTVYYENSQDYFGDNVELLLQNWKEKPSGYIEKYQNMIKAYSFYHTCLATERYDDALRILIQKLVDDSEVVRWMEIPKLTEWLKGKKKETDITIEKLIFMMIVPDFKDLRGSILLNFLDYNRLEEPIEVLGVDFIDRQLGVFYLEKICRKENLSAIYTLFESSEQVENYRIEICKKLLNCEEIRNKKDIQEEINEIYRQRTQRQKLNQLEKGKLSVDFSAINGTIRKEVEELFQLYNITSEADKELYEANSLLAPELKELKDRLEKRSVGEEWKIIFFISKRAMILKEMYECYLKEFCFGNNGLDIYLSTRIRHGTFANQILKVLSAHNITKERFIKCETDKEQKLLALYSRIEFSIKEFIKNKLKVNYIDKNSEAIFNYYENDMSFYEKLNAEFMQKCRSTDECLVLFENTIVDKTNEYLKQVREFYLVELKNGLSELLERLLSSAKEIISDRNYIIALEKNINDCNVELKETFDKINGWFSISQDRSWADFSFDELMELCKEIGKNLHLNFDKAIINCNISTKFEVKGAYCKYLNDIFLILQNNAFTHSGFTDSVQNLTICIDIREKEDNHIEIVFKNNLNIVEIDVGKLDENIGRVNQYFTKANYTDTHLHKEGGTGLLRTINILFSILEIGQDFLVCRNEDVFEVHIILKKGELLNEKNIIN